jgi:hypothetical protein
MPSSAWPAIAAHQRLRSSRKQPLEEDQRLFRSVSTHVVVQKPLERSHKSHSLYPKFRRYRVRFHARHIRSGVWGVFDAGVMTDLSEDDAHQQAANLNLMFSQYGQRNEADRVEVQPPVEVEAATWSTAGTLDYWVKEEHEWWGRVRGQDGRQVWIRASDLRRLRALRI